MKFGILGLGNHARNRVMPAIVKAGHEISAIYSRNIEKAREEGSKYSSTAYDHIDSFMKSGIDAVYIASPNFLHFEQAKESLARGKHVLLEKQMTLRNEHAAELVKFAAEKELALAIGFHMRFHPAVEKVKEMIRDGLVGDLTYISGMWANLSSRSYDTPDTRWWTEDDKAGGGSVMGTGVHVIDTINYITGEWPKSVGAVRLPPGAVLDTTEHLTLRYPSVIANAISSRRIKNAENSLIVCGTAGTIKVRGMFSTDVNSRLLLGAEPIAEFGGINLYEEEIKAFSAYVRGQKSKIATGADGEIVVRIVNAAVTADREGKSVPL